MGEDRAERLRQIRSGNEPSYDAFAAERSATRPRQPDAIAPRVGSPWLAIWGRPTETIRAIVESDPGHRVLLLAALDGLARALNRAMTRHLGDAFPLAAILGGSAVLGPLAGLAALFVGGAILRWVGNRLGGSATGAEVRAAIAWGAVPRVAMLLPLAASVAIFGDEVFLSVRPKVDANPALKRFLVEATLANLVLLLWSLALTVRTLAAVFRMPGWKVLLAAVLTGVLIFAAVFVPLVVFQSLG